MKRLFAIFAFMMSGSCLLHARDAPEPTTNSQAEAQARQFGIFFGGTASQYDLCAKKGFLPKGNQSAEEMAKAFLERTWAANPAADQAVYVMDGWDRMKREISENESFYTQQRCAAVSKQWAKLLEGMRKR